MNKKEFVKQLPDGTVTKTIDEYLDWWHNIGDYVANKIGYTLVGFDPTFHFSKHIELPDGKVQSVDSFQISYGLIKLLTSADWTDCPIKEEVK